MFLSEQTVGYLGESPVAINTITGSSPSLWKLPVRTNMLYVRQMLLLQNHLTANMQLTYLILRSTIFASSGNVGLSLSYRIISGIHNSSVRRGLEPGGVEIPLLPRCLTLCYPTKPRGLKCTRGQNFSCVYNTHSTTTTTTIHNSLSPLSCNGLLYQLFVQVHHFRHFSIFFTPEQDRFKQTWPHTLYPSRIRM